jgi:prepilin-type N-terminal cleavage/methylation domain-containing protein
VKKGRRSTSAGFSLVETMVAMVILSLTALALAPLMLRATRTAVTAEAAMYQQAVMAAEGSRLNALPYDALSPGTTCTSSSTAPLAYTRCTTVTTVSSGLYRVSVVVTPSTAQIRPDTLTFDRTQANTWNPLNTP